MWQDVFSSGRPTSKWIGAFPVPLATSLATIEKLCPVFAQFGLPEKLPQTMFHSLLVKNWNLFI